MRRRHERAQAASGRRQVHLRHRDGALHHEPVGGFGDREGLALGHRAADREDSAVHFSDCESDEETAYVELKLALSSSLRQWRTQRGVTQMELAKRLRSSQSRIAKMEAADTSVSIDLLVRSLLSIGATRSDLAKAIVKRGTSSAA